MSFDDTSVKAMRKKVVSHGDTSYIITKVLGKGAFGKVSKVVEKHTGTVLAMKEIKTNKSGLKTVLVSSFNQEKKMLLKLNHQNVVKIVDFWEKRDRVYIVTEFASGGTIGEFFEREFGSVSVNDLISVSRAYFKNITKGLNYLHNMKVFHRDIKPANILVDQSGVVKIADFGISRFCSGDEFTDVSSLKGTYAYCSPEYILSEVLDVELSYPKVDVWALAISIIQILTGGHPFSSQSNIKKYIAKMKTTPLIPESIRNQDLRDILRNCLQIDPKKRFTTQQMLDHPFFFWWKTGKGL